MQQQEVSFTEYDYETLKRLIEELVQEIPDYQHNQNTILHFAKEFVLLPNTVPLQETFTDSNLVFDFLQHRFQLEEHDIGVSARRLSQLLESILSQIRALIIRLNESSFSKMPFKKLDDLYSKH
jgi:hypothetical protein